MRALIVEDVQFLALILQRFIEPYGRCDIASDGLAAIDMFSRAEMSGDPYNLICLDILMPKLDGFEVLKSIREFEKDLSLKKADRAKIIMITTFNDADTVSRARRAGCDKYISKPFSKEKVISVLKELGFIEQENTPKAV